MTKRELFFEAGVQYGHKLSGWNPRMKPFIWGKKDSIHIINLAITEMQVAKAEEMLESIAAKGKPILWVGTKKVAKNIIKKYASETTSPFFADHWVGGTLTNHNEVKKAVTNMLYDKEIFEKSDRAIYTKKELNTLRKRIDRAQKNVGGIEKLAWPIGALVVADVMRDCVAVREAIEMKIPVIALVDTNCDPNGIDIVIPANDDLESSIEVILKCLAEAVARGKERFAKEAPTVAITAKEDNKKPQGQNRFQKNDNNNRYSGERKFNNNNRSDNRSDNRSENRNEGRSEHSGSQGGRPQHRSTQSSENQSTDNKRAPQRSSAAPVQELKRTTTKEHDLASKHVETVTPKAIPAEVKNDVKVEAKKIAPKSTDAKKPKATDVKKTTASAESKAPKAAAKKKA